MKNSSETKKQFIDLKNLQNIYFSCSSTYLSVIIIASINQYTCDTRQLRQSEKRSVKETNTLPKLRESLTSPNEFVMSQDWVKTRKAADPKATCRCTFCYCVDQISEVFSLFQMFIENGWIPTLWKTSRIISIPKLKKTPRN